MKYEIKQNKTEVLFNLRRYIRPYVSKMREVFFCFCRGGGFWFSVLRPPLKKRGFIMYAVLVSASGESSVVDLSDPVSLSVDELLGCQWEVIRPSRLLSSFVMVHQMVEGLPLNLVGSYLSGCEFVGQPVYGSVLFLADDGQGGLWGLDLLQVDWFFGQVALILEAVHTPLFRSRFKF